jgi:hypothetical protein
MLIRFANYLKGILWEAMELIHWFTEDLFHFNPLRLIIKAFISFRGESLYNFFSMTCNILNSHTVFYSKGCNEHLGANVA